MNKLPVLVGTALLIGFSYANAQSHAYVHDGHGRGGVISPRPAHTEVHAVPVVPAVALVHDSHSSYRHGAAMHDLHRESRQGMDHGRREHERRHHDAHAYGPRGH
ncbi:exported hypothetical protein [Cupriavidus necator]|uniref:Uncharacterized protein n=1 Tax=Cupriavidus necator TaxID=106590 RepID=A0A1K0IC23_CUPNE|nr:exported hypothetical protein [Cupriavidus necator]